MLQKLASALFRGVTGQLFRVLQYRKQLRRTNPLNHAELKQILAPLGPASPEAEEHNKQKSVNILRAICLVWGLPVHRDPERHI